MNIFNVLTLRELASPFAFKNSLVFSRLLPCFFSLFCLFLSPLAAEEKSAIDLEVEKKLPLFKNVPLNEMVTDFSELPDPLHPKQVKVSLATDYHSTAENSQTEPIDHLATVIKIESSHLILALPDSPTLQAQVAISDTDFEERVTTLSTGFVKNANQKIIAKRAAMKAAMEKERLAALAKKEREAPTADPKKYGRDFRGSYFPTLRNGLGEKHDHEIPLGPIAGKALVLYDGKEATITELWDKGPGAESGLQVGDRILKLNGKKFHSYSSASGAPPKGFPEALGLGILSSQATRTPLILTLERDGKEQTLSIALPALPTFRKTFPLDCPRSDFQVQIAADYLASQQKDDGSWQFQNYGNAWSALALLATGNKQYSRQIKLTAQKFVKKYEMGTSPSHEELVARLGALDNWSHAMAGIFLAEYYLATGDKSVLKTIDACCRRLEARLEPETGRLGHQDTQLPYGGFGLVIINTQAHILWGLAARINDMEWNWEPWELSMLAVKAAVQTPGAVGYSKASRGQKQSAPRSGSLATGLVLAEQDSKMQREIGDWLGENRYTFPDTHSMTSLGIVYGFMGLKNTNPKKLPDCYQDYQWMYALTTPPHAKDGVYYYGCRDNHNGDKYIKYQHVGNWITIMTLCAHRNDTLWSFGNRTHNWFK